MSETQPAAGTVTAPMSSTANPHHTQHAQAAEHPHTTHGDPYHVVRQAEAALEKALHDDHVTFPNKLDPSGAPIVLKPVPYKGIHGEREAAVHIEYPAQSMARPANFADNISGDMMRVDVHIPGIELVGRPEDVRTVMDRHLAKVPVLREVANVSGHRHDHDPDTVRAEVTALMNKHPNIFAEGEAALVETMRTFHTKLPAVDHGMSRAGAEHPIEYRLTSHRFGESTEHDVPMEEIKSGIEARKEGILRFLKAELAGRVDEKELAKLDLVVDAKLSNWRSDVTVNIGFKKDGVAHATDKNQLAEGSLSSLKQDEIRKAISNAIAFGGPTPEEFSAMPEAQQKSADWKNMAQFATPERVEFIMQDRLRTSARLMRAETDPTKKAQMEKDLAVAQKEIDGLLQEGVFVAMHQGEGEKHGKPDIGYHLHSSVPGTVTVNIPVPKGSEGEDVQANIIRAMASGKTLAQIRAEDVARTVEAAKAKELAALIANSNTAEQTQTPAGPTQDASTAQQTQQVTDGNTVTQTPAGADSVTSGTAAHHHANHLPKSVADIVKGGAHTPGARPIAPPVLGK